MANAFELVIYDRGQFMPTRITDNITRNYFPPNSITVCDNFLAEIAFNICTCRFKRPLLWWHIGFDLFNEIIVNVSHDLVLVWRGNVLNQKRKVQSSIPCDLSVINMNDIWKSVVKPKYYSTVPAYFKQYMQAYKRWNLKTTKWFYNPYILYFKTAKFDTDTWCVLVPASCTYKY